MTSEALPPSPKCGIWRSNTLLSHDWPTPLHYIMTDPDTGRKVALTELKRCQENCENCLFTNLFYCILFDRSYSFSQIKSQSVLLFKLPGGMMSSCVFVLLLFSMDMP